MQPPVSGPPGLLDAAEELSRRKKTSLWFVGSLLLVSALIVTVGLAATTRTENVAVGGYYPGVILGFGSFLGIIGINLVENRRQMLVAAIVFISFGVVAAFCCLYRGSEPRPLTTGRCQFYSSGVGYLYDVYQTEVSEMQAVMTRGRLPPSPGPSEGAARRCLCVSSLPCVDSWLQLNAASHPYYACRRQRWLRHPSCWATEAEGWPARPSCRSLPLWVPGGEEPHRPIPSNVGLILQSSAGTGADWAPALTSSPSLAGLRSRGHLTTSLTCGWSLASCGDATMPSLCSAESSPAYYEFIGVRGCQDVLHLYRLLWASAVLNVLGLFLGIITAAVLGAFKDMPCSRFPVAPASALALSEDLQSPSPSSSGSGLPGQAPPCYVPTYFPPGEKPPPYAP
ncbi:transmembrane protein 255B [Papio anubis]|uniref:transmembrane protein 255B n=1 Tax=Papio anubis TaxID=9555 RepID=UPI0012AD2D82|nr:transmembrane protein 255B [Papio anubis]